MTDHITDLPESACLQLLASGRVGRIATNDDPSPLVLPVNYAARGHTIVFTTAEGSTFEAARAGEAASFEVDGVDEDRRSGWSVLARGRLATVEEGDDEVAGLLEDVDSLAGERPNVVRLDATEVTGRRIPPDAAWTRAHRRHHTWTGQDASDLMG